MSYSHFWNVERDANLENYAAATKALSEFILKVMVHSSRLIGSQSGDCLLVLRPLTAIFARTLTGFMSVVSKPSWGSKKANL